MMRGWLLIVFRFWSRFALAVTCTDKDWDPGLCNLEVFEGTRCATLEFFRTYCDKNTNGCAQIPGGCIGFTPPGHWYPVTNNGTPRWRCRCGCFGEKTLFPGLEMKAGRELINENGEGFEVAGLDD